MQSDKIERTVIYKEDGVLGYCFTPVPLSQYRDTPEMKAGVSKGYIFGVFEESKDENEGVFNLIEAAPLMFSQLRQAVSVMDLINDMVEDGTVCFQRDDIKDEFLILMRKLSKDVMTTMQTAVEGKSAVATKLRNEEKLKR